MSSEASSGEDEDIGQYTWKGDTWWMADRDCPDCDDETVKSNGTVHTCIECDWWEVVDE